MVTATGRTSGPVEDSLTALSHSRRAVLTVPHALLAPAPFAAPDLTIDISLCRSPVSPKG